jgi:hypothetical protein
LNSTPTQHYADRKWALWIGLAVIALTIIPYLIGLSMANGRPFMWLGYNLDDSCVYLSWMWQARAGSFRQLNLFTTEPQHGMALNPLFLLLGNIARFTGLPLIAVYQISRPVLGLLLLALVWRLIEQMTADRNARKLAFLFVCFSAGLGWLPLWWDGGGSFNPVDKWQPEAITFLSLYLSPLFCASMALQVAIILLLFQADRTQQLRPALLAGACGFALGLIHTYDVLSLAAVWLTYLLINTLRPLKNGPPTAILWRNGLVAGAITLPAVWYIYRQLATETVFKARAAVPTMSPDIRSVLLGYGVTLLLALLAIYRMAKTNQAPETGDASSPEPGSPANAAAARLLICWAVANLAVSYLPTTFQRKLLQGEHFPVAILAGLGAAWLFSRFDLKSWRFWGATALLTLFLSLTNVRFVLRDIDNYAANRAQTGQQRTYLKPGEIEALNWITVHVPRNVAIQPLPYVYHTPPDANGRRGIATTDMSVACFTPGLTGHHVYCGHWGETPDYSEPNGGKLSELSHFATPRTTDEQRIALLKKMNVGYLIFSQKDPNDDSADELAPMFRERVALPDYLKRVHSNDDADVYQVDLSHYGQ